MLQNKKKEAVAKAAITYIEDGDIIGVGTGSTIRYFIEELANIKDCIQGTIPSSVKTEQLLRKYQIPILSVNNITEIPIYIDGADEATLRRYLIKGGGGALTREKIIAAFSRQFVCIVDDSKIVPVLGCFPLPIEIIPMAKTHITTQIAKFGGKAIQRPGFATDNGNMILDIHDLNIDNPVLLEQDLNQLTGVVTNGIFAKRPADVLLVGHADGVQVL